MLHTIINPSAKHRPAFGDCANPEELIARHSPTVRRIAWNVHSRMAATHDIEDLMQIGLIALFEAAQTYEDRGFAFTTYASTRIRGSMIDHLRKEARIGRSAMQQRRRLIEVRTGLQQQLMCEPDARQMANALGLEVSDYHDMVAQAMSIEEKSIDDIYSDHDANFADDLCLADAMIESAQMRDLLIESIAALPEREAMVLQLFFIEELNLQEIGTMMGVGAARICQIKKAALGKLRFRLEQAL